MHIQRHGTARLRQVLLGIVSAIMAVVMLAPAPALADASAVKGKTFTIATDTTFAPFEYRDGGELVGIDMDLIRAIAEREGFQVDIQSLGFNAALQAVTSGTADMAIAGASITPERQEQYDFSDPYFDSGVVIAVPKSSDVASYDDLKGKTITAKTGAEGETFANSLKDQYGVSVYSVDQASTMYQVLSSGNAQAVCDDYPVIAYGITQGQDLKIIGDKQRGNSYGALVAKGKNQDLLDAFNEGLASLKADGTYDQILQKYLGSSATSAAAATTTSGDPSKVQGQHYVVATDTTFAPFEYRDGGELVGIDMDLIRAIADEEGFTVDIQSLGFNAALQAVTSGTADMAIAGASITPERQEMYDFSAPYFDSGVVIAVPKSSDVASYDDLKGKTITAKTGAEGETFANSLKDQYGVSVYSVDQASTMYQVLSSGNAQAVCDDYPVIAYGITQGQDLKIIGDKQKGNSYGALVAKGKNQDLLAAFNEGLSKLQANGKYDEILTKYLGESGEGSTSQAAQAPDTSFFGLVKQSLPALLYGLKNTVLITLLSFALALVIGIILGLFRVSPAPVLNWIAKIFVWLFRGTPILVWAFFFYFGIPQITGQPINIWVAGTLTLCLNSGAYITEIVRGAIEAVDPGQMEASRSLGAPYGLTMRKVILPQAVQIAIPSVINQLIIMVKDSSLLLAIGFAELLYEAQQIYAANFRVTETLIIVAAIYLIAISILTWLANLASRRLN